MASTIGSRLTDERRRIGKTQEWLANGGEVSRHTQNKYEANASAPDAKYLAAIAAYGIDVGYVITGRSSDKDAAACKQTALFFGVVDEAMRQIDCCLQHTDKTPDREYAYLYGFLHSAMTNLRSHFVQAQQQLKQGVNHD